MMDGRRLSTRQYSNIMVGPSCPCLLLHLLTAFSKILLRTHHWNPPMIARDWKMRPTMALIKEKPLLPLPHPPMTLTNLCLLGCNWGTIVPMWSMRLSLRALHNRRQIRKSRGDKRNQGKVASQTGKYGFWVLCYLLFYDSWLHGSLDNMFYFGYMSIIFELISNFMSQIYQK